MAEVLSRLQELANYYTQETNTENEPIEHANSSPNNPLKRKAASDPDSLLPEISTEPRRKRLPVKRWSDSASVRAFIPGVPLHLPNSLTREEMDALLMRARIEELTYQLKNEEFESIPRRSPSPPPIYDGNGKRTNTREQRSRAKMERERHMLIEEAKAINPVFKPPLDYRPVSTKVSKKIRIPVDKHPTYNFIGLILGPRGSTQKEMEKKTGTKISIRGKGAVQNESKRRYNNIDDNEDLHVLITGDTEKSVKEAGRMIEELLIPIDDEKNEHKWKQLERLAEWNGTKTGNWRQGKSKRQFSSEGRSVYCTFCDEISHPTADCPFKDKPGAVSKFDQEYKVLMDFINSVGEPQGGYSQQQSYQSTAPASSEHSYDELMAYVNNMGETNSGNSSNNFLSSGTTAYQAAAYQQAQQQQQQQQQSWGAYAQYGGNYTNDHNAGSVQDQGYSHYYYQQS